MMSNYIKPTLDELQNFNKAWNHPNKESHREWQEAICKEITDIKKQQIWQKMLKSLMPPNLRCVKNKWFFKISQTVCSEHVS